jgi:MoaD family protein
MTRVVLRYFAAVREAMGETEQIAEVEGGRVSDVLDWLVSNHGERLIPGVFDSRNRLRREYRLLHNGSICPPPARTKERISEGDEIVLVPPVAGG